MSSKLEAYATEMEVLNKAFEDNSLPIQAVVIETEKYMVKVLRGPLNKKVEFLARLKDFVKKTLKEQRRGVGNP